MCDAIKKKKTSGINVATVWSRMKKKTNKQVKKKHRTEPTSTKPGNRPNES